MATVFGGLLDEAQARFGWSVFLTGLRKRVKVVDFWSLTNLYWLKGLSATRMARKLTNSLLLQEALCTTVASHSSTTLSWPTPRHKPPHPEFSKLLTANVWTGNRFEPQQRLGGTQKLDGFFARFRRIVGRKPLNTAGPSDSQAPRMEELMNFSVRAFQLKFWLAGCDMFALYGSRNPNLHAVYP